MLTSQGQSIHISKGVNNNSIDAIFKRITKISTVQPETCMALFNHSTHATKKIIPSPIRTQLKAQKLMNNCLRPHLCSRSCYGELRPENQISLCLHPFAVNSQKMNRLHEDMKTPDNYHDKIQFQTISQRKTFSASTT